MKTNRFILNALLTIGVLVMIIGLVLVFTDGRVFTHVSFFLGALIAVQAILISEDK
jgi:hypothetical protein